MRNRAADNEIVTEQIFIRTWENGKKLKRHKVYYEIAFLFSDGQTTTNNKENMELFLGYVD